MDEFTSAIRTPSVVLDRAIHRCAYRSWPAGVSSAIASPRSVDTFAMGRADLQRGAERGFALAVLFLQPPVGMLFAAFLGENPVRELLGPRLLGTLPPQDAAALTGKSFFPSLLSGPLHHGLVWVFAISLALSAVAAVASALRGRERARAERPRRLPSVRRPAKA